MVPCMGTVTCPDPVPVTAEVAARFGRPAARPETATGPRSGTQRRTEKRRPSTSAVTSRWTVGTPSSSGTGAVPPAGSTTRPLRSRVSSTHLVEWVAAAKSGYRLSEMPPDVCPEGKLTREIARDPRYGMPVRVLILDEFQEWFDLGDISKDIAALLVFLLKVAPGAGVGVIGATQKPSGIGTGQVAQQFTAFRDNFAVRFGLRTSSWQVSEMVLGQGAYSEGLDTSTLLPQYKGVGILRGATDASPTVRTYLADGQDAERILVAARAIRQRAGTLSGMALGETPPEAVSVAADVLAVFGTDTGLQWQIVAERLRSRLPDRYRDATAESVSAQVRAAGVPSVDVKQFGKALKGCRRADVEAVAQR